MPIRATIFAILSLFILLAVITKFDLETVQFNAVNAFVYADLDETVYMRFPLEYNEDSENSEKQKIYGNQDKVLRLNKTFYGFCSFFFLWQKKFIVEMKQLSFKKIFQKSCIIQKDCIISFFYVDGIVFVYKKDCANKVKQIVEMLQQKLTIKIVRELK